MGLLEKQQQWLQLFGSVCLDLDESFLFLETLE